MKKIQLSYLKKNTLLFLFFLLSYFSIFAKNNDSTVSRYDFFKIGIDLSKIPASYFDKSYNAYEFTFDAHYKKDLFWVADFGFGNSNVDNHNLSFQSKNLFMRLGLDKTFFAQDFKGDFDNAFVGLRYGLAYINRSAANYLIQDTVWGNTQGNIPSSNFLAHWLELTGGFRVEVKKHIFLGWNIRFKTFINTKKIQELPPNYIAGYGRGEKNTAFGYNLYLLYGFGKRE